MIVVDASALVELVLNSPAARVVAHHLQEHRGAVHAPSFVLVEVASALRRLEARDLIDPDRATAALTAVRALGITVHDPAPFLTRAWALRHAVTSYDAVYVALAESLGAPLVTGDAPLARSHGHTAQVRLATAPAMSSSEWMGLQDRGQLADPSLATDLRDLLPETTEDLPWL